MYRIRFILIGAVFGIAAMPAWPYAPRHQRRAPQV